MKDDSQDLVIARTFDAPIELVWRVCTEAEHLAHWWGPAGFTMKIAKLELRPGGVFHYMMQPPGGEEMWGLFVYREIVKRERIVFVNSFSDAEGSRTRNPWMDGWPLEVINTQTFEEADGKTTLTLRGGPINATDEERALFLKTRPNMEQGFAGTYDALDQYLATLHR